jgi:hypothetical protein
MTLGRLASAVRHPESEEALPYADTIGSRKPSKMMAAMLKVCPGGTEITNLFACLFLQRLPRELRVLLAQVHHRILKLSLAQQVDELWALVMASRRPWWLCSLV